MAQVILFNVTNGLIIGAFYVLMALGLSLILNLSNVINFAHGNFLALGGYLSRVAGIVFGGFENCRPGSDGRPLDEVLEACAGALTIPVVAGAPFGHGSRNESFVLGTVVHLKGDTLTWAP